MSLGDSMDVPFETQTPAPMDLSDGHIAGGVVIMAAVVPVDGMTPRPCLAYRFTAPDGSFYPPMVLVADDDQIAKTGPLTAKAVTAALAAARAAR